HQSLDHLTHYSLLLVSLSSLEVSQACDGAPPPAPGNRDGDDRRRRAAPGSRAADRTALPAASSEASADLAPTARPRIGDSSRPAVAACGLPAARFRAGHRPA